MCWGRAVLAQASAWDHGVGKDLFKESQTPVDPKNSKKQPKPVRRLAPQSCDDCQKIVDQLQAALDDWYALGLADATANISKSIQGDTSVPSQADSRAQKEEALAGLGQKEKPAPKGKDKSGSKKEIAKLAAALQECLKKCAPTEEPQTPTTPVTPAPNPPGNDGGGQAVPKVQLPTLPVLPGGPCWKDDAEKKKFNDDWAAAEQALLKLRKKNLPEGGGLVDDEAVTQINEAFKKLNDMREQADKKKGRADCGHGMAPGRPGGGTYVCSETGGVKIAIAGTGETIGHVADLAAENMTDQPINCAVAPVILESGSGKNQDYACPKPQEVALRPHEKKTIPLDGICLNRNKPPVGKGVQNDLFLSDGSTPGDGRAHLSRKETDKLLRLCTAKYDEVEKLSQDGALKDLPYRDRQKQKDICLQWSTWSDPRICEITKAPPATKDDLKKVVYKQVDEHGSVPPDKKKKIDEGIDKIFEKIELTNEKAKDLEKPGDESVQDDSTVEESPPAGQPEYIGQTRAKKPTPTPAAPKGSGTKTKSTPTASPAKVPATKTKSIPTVTPTVTPVEERPKDTYQDPPDNEKLPIASYPYTKETDCGTVSISMGNAGDLIFDFKPKPTAKCPCKEFGWIQHFRPAGEGVEGVWHYDNGVSPAVTHGGSGTGAKSHPSKANQPTQPPSGTELKDWDENPWYGGTTDPTKPADFSAHPAPQTHVSDKPSHPATTYRMQLVCVETGQVIFTWAWGPFEAGDESPDKVGGKAIAPP